MGTCDFIWPLLVIVYSEILRDLQKSLRDVNFVILWKTLSAVWQSQNTFSPKRKEKYNSYWA